MKEFGEHYRRGLGMSARNNALAYGYSVTATASFGMLAHTAGPMSILRIFMFVLGSGIAFAGVNALVTRGFRQRVEEEPPVVVALATAFALVSISAGVGIAAVMARKVRRPRPTFVRTAVALTALSFVPDLTFGFDTGSAATLITLHTVAAAIVVPTLAGRLARTR